MSITTVRTRAAHEVDIPALVDSIREVNRNALRIVSSPLLRGSSEALGSRETLVVVLEELEKTVDALREATVKASASPAQRENADSAWVLDSTQAMVGKGQLVAPVEFQELMGWSTRQAVWKAAQNHRVFYLTFKAERYFPKFYADPAYDRKQLEAVSRQLGDLPGGAKLQFFLTRKGSLGGDTPLQALAAGRVAKVKDVAAAFAEVSPQD